MNIRLSTLVLALALTLPAIGCPSESADGGEGGGSSGTSGGGAGTNGGGSGTSGGGSGTNGGGSGTSGGGSGSGASADDAFAGACEMMGGDTGGSDCEGIEEYTQCVTDNCGVNDCVESAACADFVACVESAPDACENDCTPSGECQSCFVSTASCAASMCLNLLTCGGTNLGNIGQTTPGGACDQLDDCCASLSDSGTMAQCTQTAGIVRAGGDLACSGALMTYCP